MASGLNELSTGVDARAKGPLSGIRVVDLTSVVLGPLATRILGDYGADVIKVEGIKGDIMRANGVSRHVGMSSIFLSLNRNKRSLAVDLKSPEGRAVLLKLAATGDVLVHNMRPVAMERLGLSYREVSAINDSIVYCAATGFGQDGPYRNHPAFDDVIQAACGLADLATSSSGVPQYVPTLIADKTAGMAVVQAILAALFHRQRTGEGQYVEVPMFETLVEFTLAEHMGGLAFEPQVGAAGYARILDGGRRPLPTADGFMALLPYNPERWHALLKYLGAEEVLTRYDITDRNKLNECVRGLYGELAALTPSRTTAEWLKICEELDVAAMAIYSLEELSEHPHLKAVSLFESAEHPSEGGIRYIRPTTIFGKSPAGIYRPAPLVGQHSSEILTSLGYAEADLEQLSGSGVIVDANGTNNSRVPASAPDVI
jgi:crotonobetainyl-CoA:carnitine CoA-transferase CaiB-like acyl-CoA transferase